jgi:hypothetical protein
MLRAMGLAAAAAISIASPSHATWLWDQNGDRIDDRIAAVETAGPAAAHVDGILSGRLRFALLQTTAPFVYGVYVGFDHHPTDADADALAGLGAPVQVRYRSIDYIRTQVTYAQAQAIALLPGVTRVETIPILYPVNDIATRTLRARDSGELFPSVWRDLGVTGRGAVVGILDTGVNDEASGPYPGHEAFVGKFVGGGSFFAGQPALNTPIDQSENPAHTIDPEATYHGTHVAGSAIGSGGPSAQFAGMAPDAKLVDLKVLSDAGLGFGAADALDWAIYHRHDSWGLTGADSIYRGIDVLNLSLGGTDASDGTDASCAAVNAGVRAGLVVCVASGNDGNTSFMVSPGAADLALTVGSFTDNNTLNRLDDLVADYSNEGPRLADSDDDHLDEMKPNILGSGTGILSALGDPTTDGTRYHHINGTSMACPTIAGLAALVLSANPSLSPDQVRSLIQNTADHRTDNGKQPPSAVDPFNVDPNYHPSWGWGEADAYAAVKEAQNNSTTQLVRLALRPLRGPDRVQVDWHSQREIGLFRYEVERAEDQGGAPGPWGKIAEIPVASPATQIHRVANRHAYQHVDASALDPQRRYWYRVSWRDLNDRLHVEPALSVRIADSPVVARVRYSWTHDYSDGDLTVRYGTGVSSDAPAWFRMAPGAPAADSVVTVPGVPFTGTLRHYFHFDLTDDDLVGGFLPPSSANPWFLSVKEGGFLNTLGAVNDFAVTVFGPSTSTDYVSPQPATATVEKTETLFWIPLNPATSPNHAPVFAAVGPQRVAEGLSLQRTVTAADPDDHALTYSALQLPSGATFNTATRVFDWVPGFDQAGSHTAVFRVVDDGLVPLADTETVVITVTDRAPGQDLAPTLDPLHDRQVLAGERLSFRVIGHDPEGGAITYSTLVPPPAGATLGASDGTFLWTPDLGQVGVHEITFRAGDPGGQTAAQSIYVTVSEPGIGPPAPLPCETTSSTLSGVAEMAIDPLSTSATYHAFEVPFGTQRIEGTLTFAFGPVVDLDFYLLDADSNVVQSSASLEAPEALVVNGPAPGSYIWKVVAFNNPDTAQYTIDSRLCIAASTGVDDGPAATLRLAPAIPNPTRGTALISFTLPESGPVRLRVYDVAGRLVRTLRDGTLSAGEHRTVWDRRTDHGTQAHSGLYFYRLEAAGRTLGEKVVLLR